MKRIYYFVVALCVANLSLYAMDRVSWNDYYLSEISDFFEEGEEEEYAMFAAMNCFSGGPGTSHCSIDGGIDVGDGISSGCSVTCKSGYYACCGVGCKCVDPTQISIAPFH